MAYVPEEEGKRFFEEQKAVLIDYQLFPFSHYQFQKNQILYSQKLSE